MAVNLHTTHYRFGIDELAEGTHGWHAAEDANPTQGVIGYGVFLLRFTVQETGGTAAANTDNVFEYRKNAGAWQAVTTASTIVRAVAAIPLTNGSACTKRLSGTGTFESSGAGQTEDGTSGGAANDIVASGNSETECGLQIQNADVVGGDVIEFRLTSPDFAVTNDVVPTLTVALDPTRGLVSWVELETPNAPASPTRGLVSWTELQAPFQATRGRISWAEVELPLAPTRALISWGEVEAPTVPTRGLASWAAFEAPLAPTRGLISWVELQVPADGGYVGKGVKAVMALVGQYWRGMR